MVGGIVRVLSLVWIMDHLGRRAGLVYAAVMSVIGRTLCVSAQDVGMFITGRFLDGIGTFATFVAGKI
jgi:predicted MFS family arabinose efflux permease